MWQQDTNIHISPRLLLGGGVPGLYSTDTDLLSRNIGTRAPWVWVLANGVDRIRDGWGQTPWAERASRDLMFQPPAPRAGNHDNRKPRAQGAPQAGLGMDESAGEERRGALTPGA
jgi:hypothetical protein